jgi:hypothetical protein
VPGSFTFWQRNLYIYWKNANPPFLRGLGWSDDNTWEEGEEKKRRRKTNKKRERKRKKVEG